LKPVQVRTNGRMSNMGLSKLKCVFSAKTFVWIFLS
jgi:hypothetical protein